MSIDQLMKNPHANERCENQGPLHTLKKIFMLQGGLYHPPVALNNQIFVHTPVLLK